MVTTSCIKRIFYFPFALLNRLAGNPFAGLVNNNSEGNPQQGVENRAPLPNPWAPASQNSTATDSTTLSSTATNAGGAGNAAQPGLGGMAEFMQQMMQNSGSMQGLLSSPLIDAMANNPDLQQQLLTSNPLIANNPALLEQMRTITPAVMAQMRDPEFQQVLSNPEAIRAILTIQQGFDQLRTAAPAFASR